MEWILFHRTGGKRLISAVLLVFTLPLNSLANPVPNLQALNWAIPLTQAATCIEANFNFENPVSLRDLAVISNQWLHEGSTLADLNGDLIADIDDLQEFSNHWLEDCPNVKMLTYENEDFTLLTSTQILSNIDQQNEWEFEGIIVEGAIVADTEQSYEIQLVCAPDGELIFNGELVGDPLGSSGQCLANLSKTITTAQQILEAGLFYPFKIRYRSGCKTYSQYFRLLWRAESSSIFTVIPAENLYLPLEN
jgi:hypothetical protein